MLSVLCAFVVNPIASPKMLVTGKVLQPQRASRKFFCGHELADTRETGAREGAAPALFECCAVGRSGKGEDELVILAIAKGVVQRRFFCLHGETAGSWAHRHSRGLDRGLGAGRRERAEIFRQAVAHIHHGAHGGLACEPLAFGQAWREVPMMAQPAAAEFTGRINRVARACADARDNARAGGNSPAA